MTMRGCLMLMLALMFFSCTPRPSLDLDAPAPGPDFPAPARSFGTLEPEARWWEVFDDPELTRVVERTLRNPEAMQALARLERARALMGSEAAARMPKLDGDLSAGQSRLVSGKEKETLSLGLAASYEVDLWGRLEAAEDKARFLAGASEADLLSLYRMLAAEAGTLYFQYQTGALRLTLLREKLRVSSDLLAWTRQRYERGLLALSELARAEAAFAVLEAGVADAEASLKVQGHALSVLSGLGPGAELPTYKDLPAEPPLFYEEGLPSDLVRQRPDVQAAWLRVEAADQDVAMAIRDRFPRFQLKAGTGWAHEETGVTDLSGITWNLGASLAAPLVDWGRRKALVKAQEAALEGAVDAWRQTFLTGLREMADALVRNEAQERVLAARKRQQEQTALEFSQASLRYEKGVWGYADYLSAENRDLEAREAVVGARLELLRQRILLARSLGGSWTSGALAETLAQEGRESARSSEGHFRK